MQPPSIIQGVQHYGFLKWKLGREDEERKTDPSRRPLTELHPAQQAISADSSPAVQ